jgi:S-adenosylmethionine/arginine decarboxylase-like enzyme
MDADNYGIELILDLHNCDVSTFNRQSIACYFVELCDLINMEKCDMYFWDDLDTPEAEKQTSAHTVGTSAIQFILTSNITIHTLDLLQKVFVNIFSCKDFDVDQAASFTVQWFKGVIISKILVDRK